MQEHYANLLLRYTNKMFLCDDFGLECVLLFNEQPQRIRYYIKRFELSKNTEKIETKRTIKTVSFADFKYLDIVDNVRINPIQKPEGHEVKFFDKEITEVEYKFNIVDFVKYGLTKGFDWRLYGRVEWEEMQPQKKKKFMKPKTSSIIKGDNHSLLVHEMARTISLIPNELKRAVFIEENHKKLAVSKEELEQLVKKQLNKKQ